MATILIVDDRPLNRDLLSYLLARCGHVTIEAASGEEGLAAGSGTHPDLVIIDLAMPGIDGYETARRLRLLPGFAEVPFLLVSATSTATAATATAAGFDAFFPLPIEPQDFADAIAAWLPVASGGDVQP